MYIHTKIILKVLTKIMKPKINVQKMLTQKIKTLLGKINQKNARKITNPKTKLQKKI